MKVICSEGQYLEESTCRDCAENCLKCQGPKSTECIQCSEEYGFREYGSLKCSKDCPEDQFYVEGTNRCSDCKEMGMKPPFLKCQNCKVLETLTGDQKDHDCKICLDGWILGSGKSCQACHQSCDGCFKVGRTGCQKCKMCLN